MKYSLFALLLLLPAVAAADPPKVVLVGDSIRLGYAPVVEKLLAGKAVVVSPKANGGDSSNVLKHLDAWLIQEKPAVVHFNCGIHDTKQNRDTKAFQVPPEQYEANLRKIVERVRKETGATVLFATTTPIIDDRADTEVRQKGGYRLADENIAAYNRAAEKVMADLKVPVDDLRAVVFAERAKLMGGDGTHFTDEGKQKLGKAVAAFVEQHLPK